MRQVITILAAVAAMICGGGWVFAAVEHIPIGDGIYFAITTATTVGYGDITASSPAARIVAVVLMLVTIPALGTASARALALHIHRRITEHVDRRLDEHHASVISHITAVHHGHVPDPQAGQDEPPPVSGT